MEYCAGRKRESASMDNDKASAIGSARYLREQGQIFNMVPPKNIVKVCTKNVEIPLNKFKSLLF